jgi:hypothetical protein
MFRFLFSFFILALALSASAQTITPFQQTWERLHDAGGSDFARDVTIDNLGNCYMVGISYPEPGGSVYGAKILKYDPNGALLWQRTFRPDGYGSAVATQVVVTPERDVYVAGRATHPTSGSDIILLKYSETGGLRWSQIYNGSGNGLDEVNEMLIDGARNVYIGGRSETAASGNRDMLALHYDAFGTHRWTYTKNGAANVHDNVKGIALRGNRLFLGGETDRTATAVCLSSETGAEQWLRQIGIPGFEIDPTSQGVSGIGVDSAGNTYLAGTIRSVSPPDRFRMFGAKLTPSGTVPWIRTFFEETEWTIGQTMAVDPEGALIIAGSCSRASTGRDLLTVKYDTNGNRLWSRPLTYVGNRPDQIRKIVVDLHGFIYAYAEMSTVEDGMPPHAFLLKYDPAGNTMIFQQQSRNSAKPRSAANAIYVDASGTILTGRHIDEATISADMMLHRYVQAPVCFDDTFNRNENQVVSGNVFANDYYGQGATAVLVSAPADGTLTLNANGVFTYTPPANTVGTRTFTYFGAREGIRSPTRTVTMNLWPHPVQVTAVPPEVVGGRPTTGRIRLTRAHPTQPVDVAVTTSSPLATAPSTVIVPAGSIEQDFEITTQPVSAATTVTVTGSRLGQSRSANFTILPPSLWALEADGWVYSGNPAQGRVVLNGPAPAGGIVVNLSSSNTSLATVPPTVTVPAGADSATFTVTTYATYGYPTVEIFASRAGIDRSRIISLPQTKVKSVTFAPNPVTGGRTTTGTVHLESPVPPGSGMTISVWSTSSAITTTESIVIPAGARSGTFTATTVAVSSVTTRPVYAQDPPGHTVHGFLSIVPAELHTLTVSPNSVVGGSSTTGTVTLTGPAATVRTVSLSSPSSAVTVPASVNVAAGASTATFPISTSPVGAEATRFISATLGGVTRSAAITLRPGSSLHTLTISPATVRGGTSTTGTVSLTGPAPAGGAVVTLTASSSAVTVPASVTIAAGSTSATFTINTSAVGATFTRQVSATYDGTTRSANVTLTP